jgi:DNA-directed RNA polymerase specialized sigma24 family protein
VRASCEDIDDAASFAWIQFFRYQPDRDREWKGWLYRTALREAWRLNAEHGRANLRIVPDRESREPGATREPLDPRDRLEERLEFLAAMDEVRRLPKNLRAVVLLRAQFSRHRDVAEALGVSVARVTRLLQDAGVYLQERTMRRAELERPVASPRASRLRELEVDPPEWLVEAIGRAPTFNKSSARPVLAWRRAALAIEDYRAEAGWHSKEVGLGPTPIQPDARRAHERAQQAMRQLSVERRQRHGPVLER